MPRNVEIKAYAKNMAWLRSKAADFSQSAGSSLEQEDTFFHVPNGRLKLREQQGKTTSELIFYNRPNTSEVKLSDYHRTDVQDAGQLKETLGRALGVLGVVRKQRWLHVVGQTRIHLDTVENLGEFLEFEVLLGDDQSLDEGEKIVAELMATFEIQSTDLIATAYMDLLLNKRT